MIVGDRAVRHCQRTAFSIADTTTAVIGDVIGASHTGQRHRTAFVDEGTTGTAPAAFQRTVAEVQRGAFAHSNDLSAALAAHRQLAIQRVTAEVDGHRHTTFDTQRTVAEVNVRRHGDIRTVGLYRRAQLVVRRYFGLCPCSRSAYQRCH